MKRSYLSASKSVALLAMSAAATFSTACGSGPRGTTGEPIRIDGSSTVYPITSAVAQDFKKENPEAKVEVAFSGTGSGFERFCKGETDIQDASRPIEAPEVAACKAANIGYIELPVAHDGLTIIVHPSNDFATSMTVEELKTLWSAAAEKKITKWSQVRKGWPDRPIALYGPGTKSGTFDFFTATINGKEHDSRKDYTASEDDQEIVKGVAGNPDGLGYVGFGYYETHKSTLKVVPIDDGDQEIGPGAIEPSPNTVRRGLYRPLSRPLFIYVNTKRLDRPEVKAFVNYYIRNSENLATKAGGIPLNGMLYGLVQERVNKKLEGSLYEKPDSHGRSIEQLLNQ
jgi:phosphate transport system substrate-binding protein